MLVPLLCALLFHILYSGKRHAGASSSLRVNIGNNSTIFHGIFFLFIHGGLFLFLLFPHVALCITGIWQPFTPGRFRRTWKSKFSYNFIMIRIRSWYPLLLNVWNDNGVQYTGISILWQDCSPWALMLGRWPFRGARGTEELSLGLRGEELPAELSERRDPNTWNG